MVKITKRKRLKFKKGYTYLNRNMIVDEHSHDIHESLLNYFKKEDLHQYPDMSRTYQKLSEYLNIPETELLITSGVDGAIKTLFDYLDLKNKFIAFTYPNFAMYDVYAKVYGCNVIKLKGDYPEYKIKVKEILQVIPKIKVLFLDNPKSHLPNHFTHKELYNIIKECEKYNVLVFLDEVYCGWQLKSYSPKLEHHSNLIISGSFSKVSFPSIRVGWIITNKNLKEKIELTRPSYELNYFACKSIEFLADNKDYISKLKKLTLETKNRWKKFLSTNEKLKVYDSTNYVLRLSSEDKNLIKKIYDELYENRIVVQLVNEFNLVFSVTRDKKIEKKFFAIVSSNK